MYKPGYWVIHLSEYQTTDCWGWPTLLFFQIGALKNTKPKATLWLWVLITGSGKINQFFLPYEIVTFSKGYTIYLFQIELLGYCLMNTSNMFSLDPYILDPWRTPFINYSGTILITLTSECINMILFQKCFNTIILSWTYFQD